MAQVVQKQSDFGIEAMNEKLKTLGSENRSSSRCVRAPSLFRRIRPMGDDLLTPLATPEPSLFLHGSESLWRCYGRLALRCRSNDLQAK